MPWARSFWAFSPYLSHMRKFSNLSLKTDLLLNSGAKIQKKSLPVKSLRAALRAAFRAASPNKPILTAKKRYVKFTQCFNQPQISLTSILNDAPPGFKQASFRQEDVSLYSF